MSGHTTSHFENQQFQRFIPPPMCKNCHVKPKNPPHEFCDRICGRTYYGLRNPEPDMDEGLLCAICQKWPANLPESKFCGPDCVSAFHRQARLNAETKTRYPPTPVPKTFFEAPSRTASPRQPPRQLPHINVVAATPPTNPTRPSLYQPSTRATSGSPMCISCNIKPVDPDSPCFCGVRCLSRWRKLAGLAMTLCMACLSDPYMRSSCKECSQTARDAYNTILEGAKSFPMRAHSCLSCFVNPVDTFSPICSWCLDHFKQTPVPKFVPVPGDHAIFKKISDRLRESWDHEVAGRFPRLRQVWAVVSDKEKTKYCEKYKRRIEEKRGSAHEKHLWFGTVRQCDAAENKGCCSSPHCLLCRFICGATEDKLYPYMKAYGPDQFGVGFYTGRSASSAHVRSGGPSNPLRSILLTKVVTGNSYEAKQDIPGFTRPPSGYDSVHARMTVEYGKRVVDSHHVVYEADAIEPCFLVQYT